MSDDRVLCAFRLGEHLWGLDIAAVQEVLRRQDVTRLPLAPPAVRGVINLRGTIVTAVDLRRCLGLPAVSDATDPANIVVRAAGQTSVSLLVDEIENVVTVPAASGERAPETMGSPARDMVREVFPLGDRLLLELDLTRVLQASSTPAPEAGEARRQGRSGRS